MSLNLDEVEIQFKCPECSFTNKIRLRQVRLCETIICSGCHKNIKLEDKDASTDKAIKQIKKSFEDLEKTLNQMNRR